jgi:ATP-dependent Clp protease protease subunit
LEKVAADTERDHFMTSAEAEKYGIIDRILASRSDMQGQKKGVK